MLPRTIEHSVIFSTTMSQPGVPSITVKRIMFGDAVDVAHMLRKLLLNRTKLQVRQKS
jgi:hypothetical protein